MTNGEKLLITQQRRQGLGYTEIARKLGMSVNTVKSFCQRNGIKPVSKTAIPEKDTCRQCGSVLEHTPGRKKKQFCSDACRMHWWHEHRDMSKTAKGAKMRCLRSGVHYRSCTEILQPCLLYRCAVRRYPWA